jgi:hypothetical protein
VQDVVDRVPNLGTKGAYLKQQMQDKLIKHKHYIDEYGEDMPEIRNWKWGTPTASSKRRPPLPVRTPERTIASRASELQRP